MKWARRRVLPLMARLAALAGVLLLAAWLTGRVLTDQHHWSQYLWWMPAEWVLAAVWGLWGISALLALGSTRLGGALVRPFLLIGIILATAWVLFAEWHAERYVVPVRARAQTARIAHWNLSANDAEGDVAPFIASQDPMVAIVTNSRFDVDRPSLVAGLRAIAGEDDTQTRFLERGRVMVASRLPIVGFGVARLGKLDVPDDWPSAHDTGQVAYVELDASEYFPDLGRPLVVWVVDVPSDPRLWRMNVMREARAAVDAWGGPRWHADAAGRLIATHDEAAFPLPDVVVGDFNAPRGSASVRTLVGDMREAHAAAGRGRDASFLFRLRLFSPGLQIDQSFVGKDWRAAGYDLARRPPVKHAMQWVDVERQQ